MNQDDFTVIDNEKPDLRLMFSLTQDETYSALLRSAKMPSKTRLIVQTVILVLLSIYCFIGFGLSGRSSIAPNKDYTSLGIGIAALVLLAVMWLFPIVYFKFEAKNINKTAKPVTLDVYKDKLVFGGDYPVISQVDKYTYSKFDDMVIIFPGSDVVAVPKRTVTAEQWDIFLQLLQLHDQKRHEIEEQQQDFDSEIDEE